MRLIDADVLMDSLDSLCDMVCPYSKIQRSVMCGACPLGGAFDVIDIAPTVDPIKHGHWIIRDIPGTYFYKITCSECSEDVTSSAPCIGFLPNAKVLWDYCPYCGAKMDEVEKDGDT